MAILADSKRDQDDIVKTKTTLLLQLGKEWLFYWVVYSLITAFVNLNLTYSVIQQNWALARISFSAIVSFVRSSVLNYQRFLRSYFYKLSLILHSTNPAEIENLNFFLSNDSD